MTLKYCGQRIEAFDTVFRLLNETDPAKILALNCAGITTGTTRTLTIPDASGTIALTSGVTPNVDGLTEETAPLILTDHVPFYDVSAAAHRKALPYNLQNARVAWGFREDFLSLTDGLTGLTSVVASGSNAVASAEQYHPGCVTMSTGTSATGRANFSSHTAAVALNSGKVLCRTILKMGASLSDGTNTFTVRAGLVNAASGEGTHGVFFRYSHGVNSGKWQAVCRQASTESTADTGTTVAVNTWYDLAFVVNANASSVEFFINGTSVGTITTNIPNHNQQTGCCVSIEKTVGTTARTMLIDLYEIWGELSTAR